MYIRIYNIYGVRNGVIEVELDTFIRKTQKKMLLIILNSLLGKVQSTPNMKMYMEKLKDGKKEVENIFSLFSSTIAFVLLFRPFILSDVKRYNHYSKEWGEK